MDGGCQPIFSIPLLTTSPQPSSIQQPPKHKHIIFLQYFIKINLITL